MKPADGLPRPNSRDSVTFLKIVEKTAVGMKLLLILPALLIPLAVYAQADDAEPAESSETEVSDLTLEQMREAAEELADIEAQIAREEERLDRIMSELMELRRLHAMLSNAESAYLLGEELYNSGSIVWARDAYQAVVDNFPTSIYYEDALFRLELISFELQDYDGALQYFETLRQTDPAYEFIDLAYIAAGLSTYNKGDFAGSRVLYNNILPSSEFFVLSEYLEAVSYVEERNIEAAISALQNG